MGNWFPAAGNWPSGYWWSQAWGWTFTLNIFNGHQELVEQHEALESQMKEALRRWQDRFGMDVETMVDIVTGKREVRFWGIPVSFSADVLRDIVVRLRD